MLIKRCNTLRCNTLRLITWNCAMAFRRKWPQLLALRPDIAVVQECETPDKWPAIGASSILWHGENRNKGLAVVSFGDWHLEPVEQLDTAIQFVLPARVTGPRAFNLLGVWTKGHLRKERSYIGQMHLAAQVYGDWLRHGDAVVIGDWNSNARWDRERTANHTATAAILAEYGLVSAYHSHLDMPHSAGQHGTWYNHKRSERGFHIDYCFIPQSWSSGLRSVTVGDRGDWMGCSDHCPLIVELRI